MKPEYLILYSEIASQVSSVVTEIRFKHLKHRICLVRITGTDTGYLATYGLRLVSPTASPAVGNAGLSSRRQILCVDLRTTPIDRLNRRSTPLTTSGNILVRSQRSISRGVRKRRIPLVYRVRVCDLCSIRTAD